MSEAWQDVYFVSMAYNPEYYCSCMPLMSGIDESIVNENCPMHGHLIALELTDGTFRD